MRFPSKDSKSKDLSFLILPAIFPYLQNALESRTVAGFWQSASGQFLSHF